MKKEFFLFLILFLFWGSTFGQTIILKDKSDLQVIKNAYVYSVNRSLVEISNEKGMVDISKFKDSDSIFITHVCYQKIARTKSQLLSSGSTIYLIDNVIKLYELTISANKSAESRLDVPNKIDIISSKEIKFQNPQTSGDLLQQSGNVFIQQSQMGGGSAVLRGFEANKVLMVIDGVRMNNAIYRGGHLQNVITIDPNILDKVEILYGPGSVIYGSDALGGVVNFQTKNPKLRNDFGINGSAMARYSTANSEKSVSVLLDYGSKKWAFLTAISYKNLGDLYEGALHSSDYPNFGYCGFYADRINNKDTMIINNDSTLQKNTAYSQYDILQKILFKPNDKVQFLLNFQLSNSSDIPRYDRLTEKTAGKPTYAEWYYGPQFRSLLSLNTSFLKATKMYDNANIIVAWQNISEDRINRKFNNSSKTHQEETVNVISFNYDLSKKLSEKDQLFYGIDFFYNDVKSLAYKEKITTGLITYDAASRYPDDKNTYITTAGYASNVFTISPKLKFNQGLRFSYVHLNSVYSDTMMKITKFPFDNIIQQNNSALNGNLGLVYLPGKESRIALSLSSGYRAPNVDDVSKVNDSKAANNLLVVPNPDLKSEFAYNFDLSASKIFYSKIQIEGTIFYTLLTDAIALRNTQLSGSDSVMYDGKMCQVQTNMNVGKAEIYGMQASIKAQFTKSISLLSNLTYTHGLSKTDNLPLDHIPPIYGITSLKFELSKFKAEFYARYNGWKHIEDYSPSGEDNQVYATADGMPSWFTLNARASYQLHEFANIQIGIENIMNVHYRYFASGVSAPGRNIYISVNSNF